MGLGRPAHERLVRHQDRRPRRRSAVSTSSCPARTARGARRWWPTSSRVPCPSPSSTSTYAGCSGSRSASAPSVARASSGSGRPTHRAGRPRAPGPAAPAGDRRDGRARQRRRAAAGRARDRWPSSAATRIETVCMGGGSAQVNPPHQVSIAEGLGAALGERLTVVDGVEVRERPVAADPDTLSDPETGEPGVRARYYDADGQLMAEEHSGVARRQRRLGRLLPASGGPGDARSPASARAGPRGSAPSASAPGEICVDGTTVAGRSLAAEGHDPGESMLKPPAFTHGRRPRGRSARGGDGHHRPLRAGARARRQDRPALARHRLRHGAEEPGGAAGARSRRADHRGRGRGGPRAPRSPWSSSD